MTFQAWKMVLLNSMTFQEEWSPWWQECSIMKCIFLCGSGQTSYHISAKSSFRRFQKTWIQYIVRTYWLPRKATSNQNARPWMVPACVMTNDNGISMLWRSDSSAVWKFTVCFCVRDKQIRISKVSCTTQHQRLTDLFPQRWRQFHTLTHMHNCLLTPSHCVFSLCLSFCTSQL